MEKPLFSYAKTALVSIRNHIYSFFSGRLVKKWANSPNEDMHFLSRQVELLDGEIGGIREALNDNPYGLKALEFNAPKIEREDLEKRLIAYSQAATYINENLPRLKNTVPKNLLSDYFRLRGELEESVGEFYNLERS